MLFSSSRAPIATSSVIVQQDRNQQHVAEMVVYLLPPPSPPTGMCLLKLSLHNGQLHWMKKTLAVAVSFVTITVGMFIFGNSVVYAIMKDVGAFSS